MSFNDTATVITIHSLESASLGSASLGSASLGSASLERRRASNRKSQAKYYQKNRQNIDDKYCEIRKTWQRENYTDEVKSQKREYYFKTRNYRNLNFGKDLSKLFNIPISC